MKFSKHWKLSQQAGCDYPSQQELWTNGHHSVHFLNQLQDHPASNNRSISKGRTAAGKQKATCDKCQLIEYIYLIFIYLTYNTQGEFQCETRTIFLLLLNSLQKVQRWNQVRFIMQCGKRTTHFSKTFSKQAPWSVWELVLGSKAVGTSSRVATVHALADPNLAGPIDPGVRCADGAVAGVGPQDATAAATFVRALLASCFWMS